MYNKLQFMLLYWMLNIDTESLKGTRRHVQRKRRREGNDLCPSWPLGVDLSTVTTGMHGEHAAYAGLCVYHIHTWVSVCVWLYVCYQWAQKVSCLISLSTWGPWECLSLSLLIKHPEEQQQRQHRIRKEAKGKHKERTIKDMKDNRFMCIQQYWCERKN